MTIVKPSTKYPLFLIIFSLLIAANSPAAIDVKGHWRLGESDPGATSGQILTNATQGSSGFQRGEKAAAIAFHTGDELCSCRWSHLTTQERAAAISQDSARVIVEALQFENRASR